LGVPRDVRQRVGGVLDRIGLLGDSRAGVSDLVHGPVGLALDAVESLLDVVGGLLGSLGEFLDFVRHGREARALLAGAGGLDVGVEREHVGLLGDFADEVDEFVHLLDLGFEALDGLDGLLGLVLDVVHPRHRVVGRGPALAAGLGGSLGDARHLVGGLGDLLNRGREPIHLDRRGL